MEPSPAAPTPAPPPPPTQPAAASVQKQKTSVFRGLPQFLARGSLFPRGVLAVRLSDDTIVRADRTVHEIFGYSPASNELIGKPIALLMPKIVAEEHLFARENAATTRLFSRHATAHLTTHRVVSGAAKNGHEIPIGITTDTRDGIAVSYIDDLRARFAEIKFVTKDKITDANLAAARIFGKPLTGLRLSSFITEPFATEITESPATFAAAPRYILARDCEGAVFPVIAHLQRPRKDSATTTTLRLDLVLDVEAELVWDGKTGLVLGATATAELLFGSDLPGSTSTTTTTSLSTSSSSSFVGKPISAILPDLVSEEQSVQLESQCAASAAARRELQDRQQDKQQEQLEKKQPAETAADEQAVDTEAMRAQDRRLTGGFVQRRGKRRDGSEITLCIQSHSRQSNKIPGRRIFFATVARLPPVFEDIPAVHSGPEGSVIDLTGLDVGRFRIKEHLGSGAFSEVWLAEALPSPPSPSSPSSSPPVVSTAAVKVIDKHQEFDTTEMQFATYIETIENEVRIMRALGKHKNIVELYDVIETDANYFIIMESLDITLQQRLLYTTGDSLPVADCQPILRDICAALAHCHAHGVAHRDLKPANVLFTKSGTAKLIDFGVSAFIKSGRHLHDYVGTCTYAAPEVIDMHPYSGPEIDIWSLGVVAYVIMTGNIWGQPMDAVVGGYLAEYLEKLPLEAAEFVTACMQKDPSVRPSASKLLAMPFFTMDPEHFHPNPGVSKRETDSASTYSDDNDEIVHSPEFSPASEDMRHFQNILAQIHRQRAIAEKHQQEEEEQEQEDDE